MYSAQTPAPRRSSGNSATILLLVAHAVLVFFTLFWVVGLLVTENPHDQCQIHNLGCDQMARVGQAAWIGVVGSAVLIILDLVLAILLLRKQRRLSFVVPLLCCIGQLIILSAVFSLGAGVG